jgi:hypothetical protein
MHKSCGSSMPSPLLRRRRFSTLECRHLLIESFEVFLSSSALPSAACDLAAVPLPRLVRCMLFVASQQRDKNVRRLAPPTGGDIEDGGSMKSPSSKPDTQGNRKLLTYLAIAVTIFLGLLGLQRFLALGGVSVRGALPCSARARPAALAV